MWTSQTYFRQTGSDINANEGNGGRRREEKIIENEEVHKEGRGGSQRDKGGRRECKEELN